MQATPPQSVHCTIGGVAGALDDARGAGGSGAKIIHAVTLPSSMLQHT